MTPKTWLLLVLQIMQNFRISPPAKKRCCQGVCTRLTDDTTRTIPRIFLVLLYNSRSLTLMISLSGEWVLIFRFASTHTLCVYNDRHLNFFPLIHFFSTFAQMHNNSFPWRALLKRHRTVKREQISTTKHLFIFCFTAENRPRNRFSVLATTRNFPQEHGPTTVLLEEEGLLWNTFLQTAKDLLLSQSHLRGTSKICFLPGHNFCWNWWPAKEGNWTFSIVE